MLNSKNFKILSLLTILSSLISCYSITTSKDNFQDQDVTTQSIRDITGLTAKSIAGWKSHLLDVSLDGGSIQKDCEPFYKLAKGKVKGNVMLFHGFTSCPQQYQELSEILANNGFNVFVPLLPGHGQKPIVQNQKIVDYTQKLADLQTVGIYENFSKKMGAMLKDEPGIKVVAGLSVGGTIAAKAMLTNPDVYDRGLLMTPFFNASSYNSILLPVLGPFIPNKEIGWGAACEDQRKLGRAGYCNFKLANVAAVRKFGLDTLKQLDSIKKPIQIIGVEQDSAASNKEIGQAVRKINGSKGCFFPKGTSHSMLSRQDNVNKDMFWLSALKSQILDYVKTGKSFDVVGKSEEELGLCRYK
ncbi:MAG: alpha/beta hydrolase [Candidatus Sericytochromatia bacterium]|nr:alpha/beta hydrolase [Candidatus Sericytochromatia bacterium]